MAHETSQTPYDLLRGKKLIIENKDSQTAIRTDYNLIANNKNRILYRTELSVDKVDAHNHRRLRHRICK